MGAEWLLFCGANKPSLRARSMCGAEGGYEDEIGGGDIELGLSGGGGRWRWCGWYSMKVFLGGKVSDESSGSRRWKLR